MSTTKHDAGEITTPDGITLKLTEHRYESDEGSTSWTHAEPVEYRNWEIDYSHTRAEDGAPGLHPWSISGDLRTPGSGMSEYNPDRAAPIEEAARARGIEFQTDHETSCSYFFTPTLADAKALVDIIEGDEDAEPETEPGRTPIEQLEDALDIFDETGEMPEDHIRNALAYLYEEKEKSGG